jgi:hypothetical protein
VTVRGYQLAVDWANNGNYTSTGDDVSKYVLSDPELAVAWGRQDDLISTQTTAATLTFALNNIDKRFSPGNTSSPLGSGNVRSGRKVRLQYLTGGTTTLFEGVIDKHSVDPNHPARAYTAECLDLWGRPADEKLSTDLYSGIRTGTAVGIVLDEIGWTGGRDIDAGATIMPWWWAEDESAADAIEKLVDSEGIPAVAYVAAGTFVFRDRHHRITRTASQTSQATFTNKISPPGSGPAGAFKIEKGTFQYDHGQDSIVNSVSFTVDQRRPVKPGVVWSTEDQIVVPASGSTVLHVQADSPFYSAAVPVEDTDFTVLSGSSPTVSLSRTSGQAVIVNLTGGASTAVLDGFALRATSVPVAQTVKVTASDATSITANQGEHTWTRDVPWANAYDAQAIADKIVAAWKDPHPRIVFTIPTFTPAYLTQILARAISDRITVRDDDTGTNTAYVIERLEHRITKLGAIHRLTVWCQPADAVNATTWFRFDTAGAGFGQGVFGQ